MDNDYLIALIETADLSATAYRAARRLLDRISDQLTVYLSADDACQLCGVTTWGAAKRVLKQVADAGVIQLHTNNCAYVTFTRAETDLQRAESARQVDDQARQNGANRAETDRQRAESARQDLTEPRQNGANRAEMDRYRAEMARQRAESARPLLGRLGRKVGREEIDNLPTSEGGAGETTPSPAEAARSAALLIDVGVTEQLAVSLARQYPFEQVRLQVFQYLRDSTKTGGSRPEGPGVIPGRLKRRHPARIDDADLATPLWQRHMSEEETAAWGESQRRRMYIPDEYRDVILG